jgi:hypothetical protein
VRVGLTGVAVKVGVGVRLGVDVPVTVMVGVIGGGETVTAGRA